MQMVEGQRLERTGGMCRWAGGGGGPGQGAGGPLPGGSEGLAALPDLWIGWARRGGGESSWSKRGVGRVRVAIPPSVRPVRGWVTTASGGGDVGRRPLLQRRDAPTGSRARQGGGGREGDGATSPLSPPQAAQTHPRYPIGCPNNDDDDTVGSVQNTNVDAHIPSTPTPARRPRAHPAAVGPGAPAPAAAATHDSY